MKYLFFFFLFLSILSCDKRETKITNPTDGEEIQDPFVIDTFLWSKNINENVFLSNIALHPVFHNGNVIWNLPTDGGFIALNTTNGNTVWDNRGITNSEFNSFAPTVFNDDLFYVKASTFHNMDLNTGNMESYVWPVQDEFMDRAISVTEECVFVPISEYKTDKTFVEWMSSSIDDLTQNSWQRFGRIDEVDHDEMKPHLYQYGINYTNSKGEPLFITTTALLAQNSDEETVYIIRAYNLQTNEIVWQANDKRMDISKPVVEGDRMYTYNETHFICIELETGEYIWEKDRTSNGVNIVHGFYNLDLVSHENLIVAVGHNNRIVALDKEDGRVRWSRTFDEQIREERESVGSLNRRINIYDNKLYYLNFRGDIMVLDLKFGRTARFHLPDRSYIDEENFLFEKNFYSLIVDDQGVIFANDGHRFLAFRLRDPFL